jgi:uncharacterized membrane protein
VLSAVVLGTIAGVIAGFLLPWQATILLSWDVTAVVIILWVYVTTSRFSPAETREYASREDDSRVSAQFLLLGASLASLVGVGLDLHRASNEEETAKVLLVALGLATVVASWFVVHTTFLLQYAHQYYNEGEVGGINFKEGPDYQPDYRDFAYVAFTIGSTWQVSDTDVTDRTMRRIVLQHSLLSYLFGAVVLATLINVIASLLQ